jgi:hypothetical protein
MKKILRLSVGVLVVAFAVIQFVPVARSNPPVESDIPTSPEVKIVLRRACYDCHSNETVWPWYSQLAPISWIVGKDVRAGRKKLNFSTWNRYSTKQQVKKLQESWKEITKEQMPPWLYMAPHPQARLSDDDRRLLHTWALGPVGSNMDEQPDRAMQFSKPPHPHPLPHGAREP